MIRALDLRVRAVGLRVEAGLQGAALVRVRGGARQETQIPADWWLTGDDDRVTVSLSALDEPDEDATARVEVALVAPEGGDPPLVLAAWSFPRGAFEPLRAELPFEAPPVAISALWQDAAAVEPLDDRDVAAIRAIVAGLREAAGRGDARAMVPWLERRIAYLASAFGLDADGLRDDTADELDEVINRLTFALTPMDLDGLRITPCAGSRVFHVTGDDGAEVIEALRDEGDESPPTAMQVYVSKLEGVWRVVR